MDRIKKDAIFLIDGSSLLYRSYYAIRPLHTSSGVAVQAIYGFCRAIKKLIDDYNPTNMVLVWDSKGKTFRSEIYEEYKQTRQAPPSDLFTQKEQIVKFAEMIKLCQLSKVGLEADDLIASLAQEFKDNQVVIVSPDKDLYQLLSARVLVYDPFKKELIDRMQFLARMGFSPECLLMFHSLVGDASDNIPGVPGIGEKTAQELTINFGTLDNLYFNLDKVEKERIKKALIAHKKDAYLSEELFKLKYVTTNISFNDVSFNKNNIGLAAPLFEELEFSSLLKSISATTLAQKTLFETEMHPSKQISEFKFQIIDTEEALNKLISDLKRHGTFASDTETTGLLALQDKLVGVSFAYNVEEGFYVPCGHHGENLKQFSPQYLTERLKPLFESTELKKIFHHAKFDELVLYHYGIDTKDVCFDSQIAAHLIRNGERQKIGLKALSVQYLGEPMQAFSELPIAKKSTFADLSIEMGAKYSAHDSLQTFKLKIALEKELDKEPSLKKAFVEIEMPICQILVKMERLGITIDPEILERLGRLIIGDLAVIEDKIISSITDQKLNASLNLNSPKQVEELLFDSLGLPVIKKSAEGRRSTDQEVLLELSKIHHIPALIAKYRELFKLKSTYIDPLPKQINLETGRIHTTYNQTDVATGRLSSSNPNLQNIPTGSGYGMKIRSAFIAPAGKLFLSADYSQIELRVLAHLSKDENLIEAFNSGKDIHIQTTAQIFGIDPKDVTSEQRQVGKRINFSIIYGLTPFGLSKDLGIKLTEAKLYIERYFKQYPRVQEWMNKVVEDAKQTGYVETLFGRRRYVPQLFEKNRIVYEQARRVAINTPVQGTSAEIIKLAMIAIDQKFSENKLAAEMILQIHDELVIEFPEKEKEIVIELTSNCMEQIVNWEVPMEVAMRIGKNWEEVSK